MVAAAAGNVRILRVAFVRAQFELVTECSACNVEGVVVELYDPAAPACAFGIPAEARCRLCQAQWAGAVAEGPASQGLRDRGTGRCPCCGHELLDEEVEARACSRCGSRARREVTRAPDDLRDRATFDRALARFAAEDDDTSVDHFVALNFLGKTADQVHASIARGERVETGFDVLFSLFQQAGPPRGAGSARNTNHPPKHPSKPPPRDHEVRHDPRAILHALVSVLAADGRHDPRETAFLDRFLAAEKLDPLRPDELRVHRPMEVAARIPPARRAEVIELMTQLACVDGVADPSELRIIESYATAWAIPQDDVDAWLERYKAQYATDFQRFFRRVRAFFLAPREPHPDE